MIAEDSAWVARMRQGQAGGAGAAGAGTGRMAAYLDRAIALLMVAILLTLAWPVGLAFWQQGQQGQWNAPLCATAPALRKGAPSAREHRHTV